ncbi:MAG: hypothetical protein QXL24_01840, partial [Candidatus Jordarchaeaceae archaeon]
PILQTLRNRDKLKGGCKTCKYRDVCGGCRARAYGYFGDVTAPDAGCIYNKDVFYKLKTEFEEEKVVEI